MIKSPSQCPGTARLLYWLDSVNGLGLRGAAITLHSYWRACWTSRSPAAVSGLVRCTDTLDEIDALIDPLRQILG